MEPPAPYLCPGLDNHCQAGRMSTYTVAIHSIQVQLCTYTEAPLLLTRVKRLVLAHFEVAHRCSAARVHHPLWYFLPVDCRQLLLCVVVLQEDWACNKRSDMSSWYCTGTDSAATTVQERRLKVCRMYWPRSVSTIYSRRRGSSLPSY